MQKAYYSPFDIKYKGLKLLDVPQQNISLHFPEVAAFIDEALAEGGEAFSEVRRKNLSYTNTTGKVLVNCQMGMSRSSTCVLAYLILRHQMSADEALNTVSIKLVLSRASNKSLNRVQICRDRHDW